jgi:hypothetical protein
VFAHGRRCSAREPKHSFRDMVELMVDASTRHPTHSSYARCRTSRGRSAAPLRARRQQLRSGRGNADRVKIIYNTRKTIAVLDDGRGMEAIGRLFQVGNTSRQGAHVDDDRPRRRYAGARLALAALASSPRVEQAHTAAAPPPYALTVESDGNVHLVPLDDLAALANRWWYYTVELALASWPEASTRTTRPCFSVLCCAASSMLEARTAWTWGASKAWSRSCYAAA